MKIGLGSLSGKFKRLKSSRGGGIYHIGSNPNIDWMVLLAGFCLVLILIVGYVVFSISVSSEGLMLENLSVGVNKKKIFDEEKLNKVIGFYEGRKVFQKSGDVPNLVDPSL